MMPRKPCFTLLLNFRRLARHKNFTKHILQRVNSGRHLFNITLCLFTLTCVLKICEIHEDLWRQKLNDTLLLTSSPKTLNRCFTTTTCLPFPVLLKAGQHTHTHTHPHTHPHTHTYPNRGGGDFPWLSYTSGDIPSLIPHTSLPLPVSTVPCLL